MRNTLELHPYDGQPYYLGAFLLGAYQEILGDLHNLFGDTNAVHVCLDEDGEIDLDAVIKGDTVREVLALRAVLGRRADRRHAQGRRARRAHGQGSPWTSRGSCCTSTNRGWKATPTWSSIRAPLMMARGVYDGHRLGGVARRSGRDRGETRPRGR